MKIRRSFSEGLLRRTRSLAHGIGRRDPGGVPEARPQVPPRPEPRQQGVGGEVQGDLRGVRHADGPGEEGIVRCRLRWPSCRIQTRQRSHRQRLQEVQVRSGVRADARHAPQDLAQDHEVPGRQRHEGRGRVFQERSLPHLQRQRREAWSGHLRLLLRDRDRQEGRGHLQDHHEVLDVLRIRQVRRIRLFRVPRREAVEDEAGDRDHRARGNHRWPAPSTCGAGRSLGERRTSGRSFLRYRRRWFQFYLTLTMGGL